MTPQGHVDHVILTYNNNDKNELFVSPNNPYVIRLDSRCIRSVRHSSTCYSHGQWTLWIGDVRSPYRLGTNYSYL